MYVCTCVLMYVCIYMFSSTPKIIYVVYVFDINQIYTHSYIIYFYILCVCMWYILCVVYGTYVCMCISKCVVSKWLHFIKSNKSTLGCNEEPLCYLPTFKTIWSNIKYLEAELKIQCMPLQKYIYLEINNKWLEINLKNAASYYLWSRIDRVYKSYIIFKTMLTNIHLDWSYFFRAYGF